LSTWKTCRVYVENMPDGLIEKHFALKVSHDLVDLYRGRSVVPLGDVHGVDLRRRAGAA
jgi:hypothetical protein